MEELVKLSERSAESRANVSLAIKSIDSDSIHLGILHTKNNVEMFLHLKWHNRLRNVTPIDDYFAIVLHVNSARLLQVAARCRQIFEKNKVGQIPYGFSEPGDCFDTTTGEYLFGPTKHGLTCSSFVLAVFKFAGLNLVQSKTWPASRPGDAEHQADLVRRLRHPQYGSTKEHADFVESQIGAVRYRPEDVAAAGTCKTLPANFNFASEKGERIAAHVHAHRASPSP